MIQMRLSANMPDSAAPNLTLINLYTSIFLKGTFNGSNLSVYSTYSMQGTLRYEYFCPHNTNLLNLSFSG